MEVDWDWPWPYRINKIKIRKNTITKRRTKEKVKEDEKEKLIQNLGGKKNELWRIWWTICTTRIKRKIKYN
jgi:hypothetical protein